MSSPSGGGQSDDDIEPMEVDDDLSAYPFVLVYLDGRREGFDGDREQILEILGSYVMDADGRHAREQPGLPPPPGA